MFCFSSLPLSWSTSSTSLTMLEHERRNKCPSDAYTHSWCTRARVRCKMRMEKNKWNVDDAYLLTMTRYVCCSLHFCFAHKHILTSHTHNWIRWTRHENENWIRTHQVAGSTARNDKNCFISLFIMQRVSFHPPVTSRSRWFTHCLCAARFWRACVCVCVQVSFVFSL